MCPVIHVEERKSIRQELLATMIKEVCDSYLRSKICEEDFVESILQFVSIYGCNLFNDTYTCGRSLDNMERYLTQVELKLINLVVARYEFIEAPKYSFDEVQNYVTEIEEDIPF